MMITEKEIRALQFGESLRTENGERYTRTIGGWIYSNFSGSAICFIPDNENAEKTELIGELPEGVTNKEKKIPKGAKK